MSYTKPSIFTIGAVGSYLKELDVRMYRRLNFGHLVCIVGRLTSLVSRSGSFQSGRAPVITILDHRGCVRGGPNKEYTGPKSNDQDDEMLVKVANPIIPVRSAQATAQVLIRQFTCYPLETTHFMMFLLLWFVAVL